MRILLYHRSSVVVEQYIHLEVEDGAEGGKMLRYCVEERDLE